MKRVAIFTTFFEADSGYSLVAVAETQIRMLINNGYDPVVLVQNDFKADNPLWQDEMVDLRRCLPKLILTSGIADDFEDRVAAIYDALVDNLANIDVCITHDIILQEYYKEHNVAMRRYADTRDDLLWLHCIHSCPMPKGEKEYPGDCRFTPPPGYIIYPNDTEKNFPINTYQLKGQEYRVIANRASHSIDPLLSWKYDRLTRDLAIKSDLLAGEVACVYPVRLDRSKQPNKIIRLLAGVQKAGREPRLLVIDWQSGGEKFQRYIDELLSLAESLDLVRAVRFTSRLDDRCHQGVPRHVVSELMDLSNVYIHPSGVETYSLVVHEAMLRGKLICLNHDFAPMRELFGDAAIYFDFGSDRVTRTYKPNEQSFWDDEALRLLAELRQNRALMAQTKARREWTPTAMWCEFEPLLYLEPIS